MPKAITCSRNTDCIDYTELLELMWLQHHTRKSVAKRIARTDVALGRYFLLEIPMPGEIVLGVADALGIKTDDIGKFFYQRKRR